MKVAGLTGSPRNGSNTEVLVEEALKGARESGADTKIFNLTNMKISPCKACQYCKNNEGECSTDDDMQSIYKEIKEAELSYWVHQFTCGRCQPCLNSSQTVFMPILEPVLRKNMGKKTWH